MRTIGDFSRMNARRCPDKAAVRMGDETLTYRELNRQSNRLGRALEASRIGIGDRIGILAFNCPEFVTISQAVAKIGAMLVPFSTRFVAEEIRQLIVDCEPKALFVEPSLFTAADAAIQGLSAPPRLILIRDEAKAANATLLADFTNGQSDADIDCDVDPESAAAIMYTSGTTGAPKGVMISHEKYLRIFLAAVIEMDIDEAEVMQLAMPLFHNGGFASVLNPGLMIGATVVCYRGHFDPERICENIAQNRITMVHWVPTMIGMLLGHIGQTRHDLSGLKKIHYGAMPISPDMLAAAMQAFPKASFYQGYGTTDCGKLARLRPEDHDPKNHRTGRPVFNTSLRIVDGEGRDVPVGGIGEIIVDSRTSGMMGYWKNEEATRKVIRDGWIYSGDMARQDENGFFTLVDRKGFLIISGGENIFPREVELTIAKHPDVADVAVFGVPDPKFGETVCAAVVLRTGSQLDLDSIRAFCDGHISRYKLPRHLLLMDELPRTATGKVTKNILRDRFLAENA